MDNSFLYDMVELTYLNEYRDKLETDESDVFSKMVTESRQTLEKALNEEQMKLVDKYKTAIISREEDIDLQIGIKLLNYGIKIGMQLQKAFDEKEYE